MPFPNLSPKPERISGYDSTLVCENTGVPDNGDNVIGLPWVGQGIDPGLIEEDWIDFRVEAQGPSVTGASVVSIASDKQSVTINFTQTGGDAAMVRATLKSTIDS
jgi:hypothetical protein